MVSREEDAVDCLRYLLKQQVGEQSVCDLLMSAKSGSVDSEAVLRSHGIRTDGARGFLVSTRHHGIAELLSGTPWRVVWSKFLMRVPGASSDPKPARFGTDGPTRVTFVPWSALEL